MNPLFDMEAIPVQEETKSSEWFTPPYILEAAREVMGSIELDPASCREANQVVRASRYYTKQDNGLIQDWSCESCWLNPPYGRSVKQIATRKSTIGLFVEKLLQEYESDNVGQAIVLATSEVNAKWFYPLWHFPICIPNHRVHFLVPEKTVHGKYSQMFGTALAYLGPNEEKFIEVFSRLGHVVKSVSCRSASMQQQSLWDYTEEAAS